MDEDVDMEDMRMVIALEFGSTYTGVAYATLSSTNLSLDQIEVLSDGNTLKFPSILSTLNGSNRGIPLSSEEGIALQHSKQDLNANSSVHDKLELIIRTLRSVDNLSFKTNRSSDSHAPYSARSAEALVTDYLSNIFEHLAENVFAFTVGARNEFSAIDIVITKPVGWSYKACNSLFKAVTAAGWNSETFTRLNEMMFVDDPEAASIFIARDMLESSWQGDVLKVQDTFIVCELGGVTADLMACRVEQLDPTVMLKPIGIPTGSNCGSVYINLAFKKWLRDTLGNARYLQLDPDVDAETYYITESHAMRTIMKDFERIKLRFSLDDDQYFLDLPKPLHTLTLAGGLVDYGQITIPSATMREFFDPQIDQIVEMILDQVHQVENGRMRVKHIFLAGGFAESQYLVDEVNKSMSLRGIRVYRPEHSWTAAVRGAVIYGAERSKRPHSVVTKCTKSYGVAVNELLSMDDTFASWTVDELLWIFKKGDLLFQDEPCRAEKYFNFGFTASSRRGGGLTVYAYNDEDLPTTLRNSRHELEVVGNLAFDLKEFPLSKFVRHEDSDMYSCTFKLILSLDDEEITAALALDGTVIARIK